MNPLKFIQYSLGVSILIGGFVVVYYFTFVLPENQKITNEIKIIELNLKREQIENDKKQQELLKKEADERKKIELEEKIQKDEISKQQELERNIKDCSKMGIELLEVKKINFASENSQINHYSQAARGCFVLITSISFGADQNKGGIAEILYNASEQEQIGQLIFNFSPFELLSCNVTNVDGIRENCKDQPSFNKLSEYYLKN